MFLIVLTNVTELISTEGAVTTRGEEGIKEVGTESFTRRGMALPPIIEVDIMIRVKRVYDPDGPDDGFRFLVDRLWPRGMKKENLQLDGWLKDVAPSDALRHWFGHDPDKWDEFCLRYDAELKANDEAWLPLLDKARKQDITLLFGAHDIEHNNALALRSFLEKRLDDNS